MKKYYAGTHHQGIVVWKTYTDFLQLRQFYILLIFLLSVLLLSACGSSSGGGASNVQYQVSITVDGLTGTGLTLQNNASDDLSIFADGVVTFNMELTSGEDYEVTVLQQPLNPEQICTVVNDAGTILNTDIDDIQLNCVNILPAVIFESYDDVQDQNDIYMVGAEGENLTAIASTSENEIFLAVLQNGRILFGRTDGLGNQDFYSVPKDSSDELPVTQVSSEKKFFHQLIQGGRILFHIDDGIQDDLYSINEDGTGLLRLTDNAADDVFEAEAPNGQLIVKRLPVGGGNVDIYAVNADGSGETPLAISPEYEEYKGVTQNNQVVFRYDSPTLDYDIYSVNIDGTGLTAVVNTVERETFSHLTAAGQLVFYRDSNIFIVGIDGANEIPLGAVVASKIENFVAETPDGKIVFLRRPSPSGTDYDIYLINADGSGEVEIAATTDKETFKAISSSGRIIFERVVGARDIYSVLPDGSDKQLLAGSVDNEAFVSAIPGGWVVYRRDVLGQSELYLVKDDGSETVILADSVIDENYNGYTNTGRVIFSRDFNDLFSVNLDGSDERVLSDSAQYKEFRAVIE